MSGRRLSGARLEQVVDAGAEGVDGCTNNATLYMSDPTIPQCAQTSYALIILLAVYMIVTNVILLNILIAMFRYGK